MYKIIPVLCFAVLLTLMGCKDIQDAFKPGSFGKSPEETAMVEAVMERYGDLREDGEPRILEAMMTSSVHNHIPKDKVTSYNKETERLYCWFVYDNFNNGTIQIEWIYLDTDHSIHTFEAQAGEDFGRGTFILEKPDDGWPEGKYKVIISGESTEETVLFSINDKPTVSAEISFANGKISLPQIVGWHLTGWEYYVYGEGEKNNFSSNWKRTDYEGDTLHSGNYTIKWSDPPDVLRPNEYCEVWVEHISDGWAVENAYASMDGFGLYSNYLFNSNGKDFWTDYSGTLKAEKPMPEGKPGDKKTLTVSLGKGYKYYYTYEWKE